MCTASTTTEPLWRSLAGCSRAGRLIDTAEAINKTFPDFVKVMKSLEGQINMR